MYKAFRHDRYCRNRGRRVPQNLQAGCGGHSHQPRIAPPTNIPDVVYRTKEKNTKPWSNGYDLEDGSHANGIRQLHESGQPVLMGTISIENSELSPGS